MIKVQVSPEVFCLLFKYAPVLCSKGLPADAVFSHCSLETRDDGLQELSLYFTSAETGDVDLVYPIEFTQCAVLKFDAEEV